MTSKQIIKLIKIRTREQKDILEKERKKYPTPQDEPPTASVAYCEGTYGMLRALLYDLGVEEEE